MRKNTSNEEYLAIADRHIEAAEQRIRTQKRRLFGMASRGEDVSEKAAFVGLLDQALHSMRRYREKLAGASRRSAAPDAGEDNGEDSAAKRQYR